MPAGKPHTHGPSRQDLLLENFALRHQLAMCQRRPRVTAVDRLLWAQLLHRWSGWRTSLVILRPDTVVRWHRRGWHRFWAWKSRPRRPGRRRIPVEARDLILRLARENPRWGAVRIRAELRTLGYDVSAETVRRYRLRAHRRPPSQRWQTFLRNHRDVIWAADFCTVPTLMLGTLYVLFVISHARHRIEHVNVTAHPPAAWTWQQLIEATPWNHRPRHLIRDRDRVYGIETIVTPVRASQANAGAERWVGTLRRECLNHIIPFNALHLRRLVGEFVTNYNETRPHRTLDLHPPVGPRPRQRHGRVGAIPILGGLHHRYERAAA